MFFSLRLIRTRNKITFFLFFKLEITFHILVLSTGHHLRGFHTTLVPTLPAAHFQTQRGNNLLALTAPSYTLALWTKHRCLWLLKKHQRNKTPWSINYCQCTLSLPPEKGGRERVYWKQDGLNTYQYPT